MTTLPAELIAWLDLKMKKHGNGRLIPDERDLGDKHDRRHSHSRNHKSGPCANKRASRHAHTDVGALLGLPRDGHFFHGLQLHEHFRHVAQVGFLAARHVLGGALRQTLRVELPAFKNAALFIHA